MHYRQCLTLLSTAAAVCASVICAKASTSQFTTAPIPAGYYDLVAWPFQSEDLNHIFGPANQTLLIEMYSNGTYYGSASLGSGFSPDFVINPGQSFFIYNWDTVEHMYTIAGTNTTASQTAIALTNGDFNSVGPAYYRGTNDYLECVYDTSYGGYRYTHDSWNYTNTGGGDLIYQWSVQNQNWVAHEALAHDPLNIIYPYYTNQIADTSTPVCSGRGLFIKPAVNTTWFQTLAVHPCDGSGLHDGGGFDCPE